MFLIQLSFVHPELVSWWTSSGFFLFFCFVFSFFLHSSHISSFSSAVFKKVLIRAGAGSQFLLFAGIRLCPRSSVSLLQPGTFTVWSGCLEGIFPSSVCWSWASRMVGQPDVPSQAAGKALAFWVMCNCPIVLNGYWTGIWGSQMGK